MSPFLTCFPLLPFGRALRAGQHSARARKSTSPHYATRCVGAKKSQRTRNFVLSSGAWHSLRSSPLLLQFRLRKSKCLSKNPPNKPSAYCFSPQLTVGEYHARSAYNSRSGYNFAKQNITHKKSTLNGVLFYEFRRSILLFLAFQGLRCPLSLCRRRAPFCHLQQRWVQSLQTFQEVLLLSGFSFLHH